MIVREKSNLLFIQLEEDEEILIQLHNIIREYKIIDAKISGYGYLKRIEYGILTQNDPVFFSKHNIESLITVTDIIGLIDNREYNVMVNSVDKEQTRHQGKLISGFTTHSFNLILDIIKTD